jgi:hypothetical protein
MYDELEMIEEKEVMVYSRCYANITMEGLRKTMKDQSLKQLSLKSRKVYY